MPTCAAASRAATYELESYWHVFPALHATLFKRTDRPGYTKLAVAVGDIKATIFGHAEFNAFKQSVTALFAKWKKANTPHLEDGHIEVWTDGLSFANAFSHPHEQLRNVERKPRRDRGWNPRHPHADQDEVHVGMLDHFVRVGKSVGNPEMLGRFICGFLAARADRRDLKLRKRAQSDRI